MVADHDWAMNDPPESSTTTALYAEVLTRMQRQVQTLPSAALCTIQDFASAALVSFCSAAMGLRPAAPFAAAGEAAGGEAAGKPPAAGGGPAGASPGCMGAGYAGN